MLFLVYFLSLFLVYFHGITNITEFTKSNQNFQSSYSISPLQNLQIQNKLFFLLNGQYYLGFTEFTNSK